MNMPTGKQKKAALNHGSPLTRAVAAWYSRKENGSWTKADYSLDESFRRELWRIIKAHKIGPDGKVGKP